MPIQQHAQEILSFWFGALNADGWTSEDKNTLWFGAQAQDDEDIRRRFGALIADAVSGKLADWPAHSDAAAMALLLLTDQMTRAIYRGDQQAFAGDRIALAVCKDGIAGGQHTQLPPIWRCFYYLPLEHSENEDDQNQCVLLFEELQQEFPQYKTALANSTDYAVQHRDIIKRFGRFPHRNALLGRRSTEDELNYLAASRQHFGQIKK